LVFNDFPFRGVGVEKLKINKLSLFGVDSTINLKKAFKYFKKLIWKK